MQTWLKTKAWGPAAVGAALCCLAGVDRQSLAGKETAAAAPAGKEVAITCNVLSNVHTGEKDKSLFLLAFDGTPEIKAGFDRIMAEHFLAKGLDADAAVRLQDQFMTHLRYDITLDGPLAEELWKKARYTVRQAMVATGVVAIKGGRKWITLSKCEPAARFAIPPRMLTPDKPFVMPDREPLVLRIDDKLSLKCIYVPAGRFLMGEPYYQVPHWQEDPPHLVTLTKPYYLAEHPVTQEIYEAVMGVNPSTLKGPGMPVHKVDCAAMYEFCERLSRKTGRKVRIPTAAEWEYAARVGTSNPTFKQKYAEQTSNASTKYASPPLPVKSKRPNAWGFYDMHSGWWERVSDGTRTIDRKAVVDPVHIPPEDAGKATRGRKHGHFGKGQWSYAISEVEYITSEAGDYRFRVVVEVEPTATAPAEKASPTATR
ncbi:MAG: SUMF1/EgtB/PvdO family nonheme iron enzyme [Phycisphaerae bacterium]